MKTFIMVLILMTQTAFAEYDSSWYVTEFWSGEYPGGFSVVAQDVSLPARKAMDPSLKADLQCGVPYKAVLHPWNAKNQERGAKYVTASKIVTLTAKRDFQLEYSTVEVKKGDKIEYLIYFAEGMFAIRHKGVIYDSDQNLFEGDKIVEDVDNLPFHQDEWLHLTCANGEKGWLLLSDLIQVDENRTVRYFPGLGDWWLGFRDYGRVSDLTDDDLKK